MSDFFMQVINSYSNFFSLQDFLAEISNPTNIGIIGSLILLEGLLSADNALVLAVMVKHLNKHEQKKALFYGLVGAYVFRFLAIGIGVFLVKIWWVKILGGGYLLYLGTKSLCKRDGHKNIRKKKLSFWQTVIALQLMDIAFSVDSIIAAFGVSDKVWVLLIGGMIGVLMMRGVAGLFVNLIEKVPQLEVSAYVLINIIGIKMILSVYGIHIKENIFFMILILILLSAFVINKFKGDKNNKNNKVAVTKIEKRR